MSKQFIQDAIRTESPHFYPPDPRILHAAIGCVTEAGEMLDALKKQMFYGRELDLVNVREEAGDLLWYLGILFDVIGTDFDTEMHRVIAKLQARFPEKFSEDNAFTRDLDAERKILEAK